MTRGEDWEVERIEELLRETLERADKYEKALRAVVRATSRQGWEGLARKRRLIAKGVFDD